MNWVNLNGTPHTTYEPLVGGSGGCIAIVDGGLSYTII